MVQVQRWQVKGARDPPIVDWRFNLSGLKNIGKLRLNESDADLQLAKKLLRFLVQTLCSALCKQLAFLSRTICTVRAANPDGYPG